MTKLPAEAYAILEGRHSDPFHYLGLHVENNKSIVRAFLPNASLVAMNQIMAEKVIGS